jgi:Trk K+ transport system NAD-binding subunit
VILMGDDSVPIRVREELTAAGVPTMSICSSPDARAAKAAKEAGVPLTIGDVSDPALWKKAGIAKARSIGVLGPEDLQNLSTALMAGKLRSDLPIILRLFSADLATGVERMLGGRAKVLSETDVAAPSFVQAAVSGNTGQKVRIAEHVLEVAEVDPADPSLVVALCNADTPTSVLPPRDELGEVVLGLVDPQSVVSSARGQLPSGMVMPEIGSRQPKAPTAPRRPMRQRLGARLSLFPARARMLLGAIALVAVTSAFVFGLGAHLRAIDAVYFTVTTMATVGYGDINLLHEPDWLKVYAICLMGTSVVLSAGLLAFITDMIISTRIERALGRFPKPKKDHVIVCGLGKAGSRIIAGLHDLHVPCIGVEQYEGAVGISVARALEIPVIFADARTPGVLEELHVDTAKAVLAVTNDDLANLQCGLAANERNPDVRVVLRMFDADLAEQLDQSSDELDLTRSVSALAAPAFAAALLERPLAEPLPLSNVPLRVVEHPIPAGNIYEGARVADLHAKRELRILALDGRWLPAGDEVLEAGMEVAAVGTREACEALFSGHAA